MLASRSLFSQMFISFTFLVLTPLLITIFMSYSVFTADLASKTKVQIESSTLYAATEINKYYEDLYRVTISIMVDKTLWESMKRRDTIPSEREFEWNDNENKIKSALSEYKYTRNELTEIGILKETGELFHSMVVNEYNPHSVFLNQERILQSEWYQDFQTQHRIKATYPYENGLLFLNRINNPDQFTEPFGVLIYELDDSLFDQLFQIQTKKLDKLSVYVFNEQGKLIYQRGSGEIQPDKLAGIRTSGTKNLTENGKTYMVVSRYVGDPDWTYLEVVPYDVIWEDANKLRNYSILLVMISYVCGLAITFLLSKQVVRPLRKLMMAMKQLGTGTTNITLEAKGPFEVREIAHRFNVMNRQIGELIAGIVEEQRKAKEADLAALQAQIHPHFLYNTLNLIVHLARKKNTEAIRTLTVSLIELLQNSLKSARLMTTIAGELMMIQHYVMLHQYRSERKIDLFISADPDLLGVRLPKFILQPLVENAIFHGFYPTEDGGTIVINIFRRDKHCILKVVDDGVGFRRQGNESPEGIGLTNVTQRIQHFYPNSNAGLQIYSRPGFGTAIEISIPCAVLEQEGNDHEIRAYRR
jgi:two-component system sensor histidine kinase YesM